MSHFLSAPHPSPHRSHSSSHACGSVLRPGPGPQRAAGFLSTCGCPPLRATGGLCHRPYHWENYLFSKRCSVAETNSKARVWMTTHWCPRPRGQRAGGSCQAQTQPGSGVAAPGKPCCKLKGLRDGQLAARVPLTSQNTGAPSEPRSASPWETLDGHLSDWSPTDRNK